MRIYSCLDKFFLLIDGGSSGLRKDLFVHSILASLLLTTTSLVFITKSLLSQILPTTLDSSDLEYLVSFFDVHTVPWLRSCKA